jgi:hypothetical protein
LPALLTPIITIFILDAIIFAFGLLLVGNIFTPNFQGGDCIKTGWV